MVFDTSVTAPRPSAITTTADSQQQRQQQVRSFLRAILLYVHRNHGLISTVYRSMQIPYELRVQGLCESRGGRRGLSVPMSLTVSADVKQH